ncbi:MAG: glycosyltransferase family 39 protein [Anaerolineaceae bacterium]|nr:glycosyltransferase family 39 protein [Anaerolineaceae bacterium]
MRQKLVIFDFIILIILLFVTISAALYFYPFAMEIPHRDSGIYLYLGKEINIGKTIYLEVWENKPPFIFFINALGLTLGNGSPWGVWGLEVVFLFTALLIIYITVRGRLNPLSSILIVMATFLATFQYISGNFTEEYSLVFQAFLIYTFLNLKKGEVNKLSHFFIGVLTGIIFNIKQTYIDVSIAIIILMLIDSIINRKRNNLINLVYICLGFLLPNLLIIIYMLVKGALEAFWQAAYVFNFAYSNIGLMEKFRALVNVIKTNSKYPFFVMMLIVWLAGVFGLLLKNSLKRLEFLAQPKRRPLLLLLGFVLLVLLIASQLISNNSYLGILDGTLLILTVLSFILFFITSLRIIKKLTKWYDHAIERTKLGKVSIGITELPTPLLLGIINLPIVMFLVVTSGRNYPHYFTTFFPSFFLLFYGSILLINKIQKLKIWRIITSSILISLFIFGAIKPVQKIVRGMGGPYTYNPFRQLVKYVQDYSTENDTVMVWSLESRLNYLSDRSSPTRYSNVHPAYLNSPIKEIAQKTIYEEITSRLPIFILDMKSPEYPFIEGMSQSDCLSAYHSEDSYLDKTIYFVCQNYMYTGQIDGIDVYKLIEK